MANESYMYAIREPGGRMLPGLYEAWGVSQTPKYRAFSNKVTIK